MRLPFVMAMACACQSLVPRIFLEPVNGVPPILHGYIIRTLNFGDLDFIFKITGGLRDMKFYLK